MYSVVLSYHRRPQLRVLDRAHAYVLGVVGQALARLAPDVRRQGTSDLTRGNRKFSGNSLRCKREHLLYHGTILYDFPLDLISRYLTMPPRQPAYRGNRRHGEFVGNFPATAECLRECLRHAWDATEPLENWLREDVATLVATRYSQASWNLRM
jgi:lipoate-protein ligase A